MSVVQRYSAAIAVVGVRNAITVLFILVISPKLPSNLIAIPFVLLLSL